MPEISGRSTSSGNVRSDAQPSRLSAMAVNPTVARLSGRLDGHPEGLLSTGYTSSIDVTGLASGSQARPSADSANRPILTTFQTFRDRNRNQSTPNIAKTLLPTSGQTSGPRPVHPLAAAIGNSFSRSSVHLLSPPRRDSRPGSVGSIPANQLSSRTYYDKPKDRDRLLRETVSAVSAASVSAAAASSSSPPPGPSQQPYLYSSPVFASSPNIPSLRLNDQPVISQRLTPPIAGVVSSASSGMDGRAEESANSSSVSLIKAEDNSWTTSPALASNKKGNVSMVQTVRELQSSLGSDVIERLDVIEDDLKARVSSFEQHLEELKALRQQSVAIIAAFKSQSGQTREEIDSHLYKFKDLGNEFTVVDELDTRIATAKEKVDEYSKRLVAVNARIVQQETQKQQRLLRLKFMRRVVFSLCVFVLVLSIVIKLEFGRSTTAASPTSDLADIIDFLNDLDKHPFVTL
jgi:hypothetical protein